jgi:hypothetical protein
MYLVTFPYRPNTTAVSCSPHEGSPKYILRDSIARHPFLCSAARAAGRSTSSEHLPCSGDRHCRAAPCHLPHSGRLAPCPPPRQLARSPPAALPFSLLQLPPPRSQREGAGQRRPFCNTFRRSTLGGFKQGEQRRCRTP